MLRLVVGSRVTMAAVAALLALSPRGAAAAEFRDGVEAHERGDSARARAIFLDLAALGDGPSQYNLGAMALRGEGVAPDRGAAAGWMLAARQNGHDPTPRAVDDVVAKLSPAEREAADAIVAKFGRAALEASVLSAAPPATPAPELVPPRFRSGPSMPYPSEGVGRYRQAIVVLRTVMGTDGRPRDPEVVLSIPPAEKGGRPFVDAGTRGVLERTYDPARLRDTPVAVNFNVKLSFSVGRREDILDSDLVAKVKAEAAAGDARAQYLAGIIGMGEHPAAPGAWAMTVAAAQAGIPEAQLFVGRQLARRGERAKALPWLQRASAAAIPGARISYALALLAAPEPDYVKARALIELDAETDDAYALRHAIVTLACSEHDRLKAPELALRMSRRIWIKTDPDPLAIEAAAAARASAGKKDDAVEAQRTAIRRAEKLGWDVTAMRTRLDGYAAGRPCVHDFLAEAVEPPNPACAP